MSSESGELRYSLACRGNEAKSRPGHGGRYGQPGDRCPRCGDAMIVTGTMVVRAIAGDES